VSAIALIAAARIRVSALRQIPLQKQRRWLWIPAFAGTTLRTLLDAELID